MIQSPRKTTIAWLFVVLPLLAIFAQTPQEIQKITKDYKLPLLQEMETRFAEQSQREKAEAIAAAQLRGVPVRMTLENGGLAELQRVLPDGTLLYYQTTNVDAARSTRTNHLNSGGSLGLDLEGQGMIAGVWDGGHARITHQEYDGPGGNNRVTIMDGPAVENFHAAHVSGTIIASGVEEDAKGMAPRAQVLGYDWTNDVSEVTAAAADGLLVSNHSYGYRAIYLSDQYFGAYTDESRSFDLIMQNAPYYLTVISAGNDGTDNTSNGAPLDGYSNYDKLSAFKTSKNSLVIANAQDATVNEQGDLISVTINSSSSQGPTDDYRIKPDIAGNGTSLYSSLETSNNAYGFLTGTSMSAPNVTGSLLLLQEHANNLNGDYMRAATLKGLVLHTADDAGPTGPDAVWGWGLLNAKRAAEVISNNEEESLIQEVSLSQGQSYSIQVEADEINDLMASISWTDVAGAVNNGTNSNTPALVNDLDIRISQNTNTYYPWRLTGVTTNSNDGDNYVDPYERIEVANPSGTYTITVTHKGTLSGGSQDFSLIVTGVLVECTQTPIPDNLVVNSVTGSTAVISWNHEAGSFYDVEYREIGASSWTLVEDIPVGTYTITGLELNTDYQARVRSTCPDGAQSDFSDPVPFTTSDTYNYCDSFSNNALDIFYISNVSLNTIDNDSSESMYSDFTDLNTTLQVGNTYTITITPTTDDPEYLTYYSVWIDYNLNESFDDPGEQVFTIDTNAQNPVSGEFTVPVGVNPGATRMRVTLSNTPITSPCSNFTYGEVEDYTVILQQTSSDYIYEDTQWTPEDPSGIATAVDNIIVVNGQTALTQSTTINNININPGAILHIDENLSLYGDVIADGTLVFVSNENHTAQLDALQPGSTIVGNVEVQRYLPARRAFRFLATAVSSSASINQNWQEGASNALENPNPEYGTHITGSVTGENGFDETPSGNPSMFTLDNQNQSWEELSDTDENTITAGTPYRILVRGDRSILVSSNSAPPTNTTLRTTGTMHTGPLTMNNLSETTGDFNFFGNPYQAVVNMNDVITASSNINSAYYYVWDPNLGGIPTSGEAGGRGAYVTVELPNGTNAYNSEANHFLQPGQAAFVLSLSNGAAALNFQENHKDVNAEQTTVFSTESRIDLRLFESNSFAEGATPSDGLRLKFAEGNTNDLNYLDAPKLYNQDENLATLNQDKLLSIESRAIPEQSEIIPLYTSQYRSENYIFEIEQFDLDQVTAYLRDHFTGEDTEISNNATTVYAFQVDSAEPASIADNRFEIVFDTTLSVADQTNDAHFVLFPNPTKENKFFIATRNLEGQQLNVEVYSMLGQSLLSENQTVGANGLVEVNIASLAAGVYTVSLSTENAQRFTTKLIVE